MLALKSTTCPRCHDLFQHCFAALVEATPLSQPIVWPNTNSIAFIFHGGQYSMADYDIIAQQFQHLPQALIYLSALDGTFAPLWKKAGVKTESAWHEQQLHQRGVSNAIITEPHATNTVEEIQAAAQRPEIMQVDQRYALTTDLHALRVRLAYIQAPTLQPDFLRPGIIQYDFDTQRQRILQEVYRVLLYSQGQTIQTPAPTTTQLFQTIVQHQYTYHPTTHVGLMTECAHYIKKYCTALKPFSFLK